MLKSDFQNNYFEECYFVDRVKRVRYHRFKGEDEKVHNTSFCYYNIANSGR